MLSHRALLLCCTALSWARLAHAAEVTQVASSFDANTLIDVRVSSDWDIQWRNGTVYREFINSPGATDPSCNPTTTSGCGPRPALNWQRQATVETLRVEAGLYHDFSFVAELPIVYSNTLRFSYASGVQASNSSVDTGNPSTTLFAHNFASYHSGLGDLGLGLRWGILNNDKDPTRPSWILRFMWTNPATTHTNRFAPTSSSHPGYVGTGIHHLIFGTALSKRLANIGILPGGSRRGYLDPYFSLEYSLPLPSATRALPPFVAHNPFADPSSHVFRLHTGVEIVPYEDLASDTKVSIDVGLHAAYFTDARNYTILSEPLLRPTFSEQVMHFGWSLGVYVRPWRYIKLKVAGYMGYDTDHWLTDETAGIDTTGSGAIVGNDQLNPYYCGNTPGDICSSKHLPSVDEVGYRFRSEARWNYSTTLTLMVLL